VLPADFDGDGPLDLAVSSDLPDSTLRVVFSVGLAAESVHTYHLQGEWLAMAAGDLDGTGRQDLYLYPDGDPVLRVLRFGSGGPTMIGAIPDFGSPGGLVVWDLDGDGRDDVGSWNGFWRSLGDGTFEFTAMEANFAWATALLDLDHDGRQDCVLCDNPVMRVTTFIGSATREIWVMFDEINHGSTGAPVSGDLDGNGYEDLICGINEGSLSVVLRSGPLQFDAPTAYPIGDHAGSIQLRDRNAEGRPEVLLTTSSGLVAMAHTNDMTTWTPRPTDYGPHSQVDWGPVLAVGRFLSTGNDIAMIHPDATIWIYANPAPGEISDPVFAGSLPQPVIGSFAAAACDADGNGFDEIAYATRVEGLEEFQDSVFVLRVFDGGNAVIHRLGIDPPHSYREYFNPQRMQIAHLNSDAHADLALWITSVEQGYVIPLLGLGDGRFRTGIAGSVGVGENPSGFAVADFNRDGCDDAVATSNAGDYTTILHLIVNDGSGNLTESETYVPNLRGAGPIIAADFDTDGDPDIVSLTSPYLLVVYNDAPTPTTPVLTSWVEHEVAPGRVSLLWHLGRFSPRSVERNAGPGWVTLAGAPVTDGVVRFVDTQVAAGERYGYRLSGIVSDGSPGHTEETWVTVPRASLAIALRGANPVRSSAVLRYRLTSDARARLEVFDLQGRRVLAREVSAPPHLEHDLVLPCERLPQGMYALRLQQGTEFATLRLVVAR
jgi:hypothetical protein